MPLKIVFIGGGSFLWTARLATDMFLKPSLKGSEMVLVDIDRDAANLVGQYCRMIDKKLDANWRITTGELEASLPGADIVIVSISTGGLEAFDKDYHMPAEHGVYHSVGDTVGPAGISRVLRNVPVFLDIAKAMETHCPDAWMIHVTNPLAQITRAVARSSPVKVVGLCHNYEGTMRSLASRLGVKREDLHANTFGVNHFSFLRDLTHKGQPVEDAFSLQAYLQSDEAVAADVKTNTTDDDVNEMTAPPEAHDDRLSYELYEMLGYYPVGGSAHLAENFPYYLNDLATVEKHRIRRKGVLPFRLNGKKRKQQMVEDVLAGKREMDPIRRSHEDLADIVESLWTGQPCQAVVNLPNVGQIPNLPRDVVVETWGRITKDAITPLPAGDVPVVLKGMLESVIAEEELSVEAALTGNMKTLEQALYVSPLLHQKDAAGELARKIVQTHRDLLPQFESQAMAAAD